MQFLARRLFTSPLTASATRTQPSFAAIRTFTTHPSLRIKEDKPQSPEELDRKKHQQLDEQKQGKGRWHEDLASAGEASITADRQQVDDHDEHMEDLQKQTAVESEKEHPHGKAE